MNYNEYLKYTLPFCTYKCNIATNRGVSITSDTKFVLKRHMDEIDRRWVYITTTYIPHALFTVLAKLDRFNLCLGKLTFKPLFPVFMSPPYGREGLWHIVFRTVCQSVTNRLSPQLLQFKRIPLNFSCLFISKWRIEYHYSILIRPFLKEFINLSYLNFLSKCWGGGDIYFFC